MATRLVETELADILACSPHFSKPAEPTPEVRKSQEHGHRHDRAHSPVDREPQTHGANRVLMLKLVSAGFSFFVAGVNDGSVGALIPYFMREYGISTTVVSTVYVLAHRLSPSTLPGGVVSLPFQPAMCRIWTC